MFALLLLSCLISQALASAVLGTDPDDQTISSAVVVTSPNDQPINPALVVTGPANQPIRSAVLVTGPTNQTISDNQSACFTCQVQNAVKVYWEIRTKKNAYIYQVYNEAGRLTTPNLYSSHVKLESEPDDSNQFDLLVHNVDKSDQGFYKCRAVGQDGKFVNSRPAELQVKSDGEDVFHISPVNTFTVVGKTVTFDCRVEMEGILFWEYRPLSGNDQNERTKRIGIKKNEEQGGIIEENPRKFSWDVTALVISNVNTSDTGSYGCGISFFTKSGEKIEHKREANLTVIDLPGGNNQITTRTVFNLRAPTPPLTLECGTTRNSGVEKIAWLDGDLNVLSYDAIKLSDNPRLSIDLFARKNIYYSHTTYKDANTYFCVDLELTPNKWFEYIVHIKGCPPLSTSNRELWKEVEELGKCFGTLKGSSQSWGEAEVWCRLHGGHLAMPKSLEESRAMKNSLQMTSSSFWIGLTDYEEENLYKWADGSILLNDQRQWNSGKPDDSRNEDCAYTYTHSNGGWDDNQCRVRRFFACETSNVDWMRYKRMQEQRCPHNWMYFDCGGFCYSRSHPRGTWSSTKHQCAEANATMLMPKTAREHYFAKMLLGRLPDSSSREMWLGLTATETRSLHEWVDGEYETWIYWGDVRSDSTHTCLTMNLPGGHINARPCTDRHLVVCQKPQRMSPELRSPNASCGKTDLPFHIKGDSRINIEGFPWVVKVLRHGLHVCNGVLISSTHVLTPAQCVSDHHDNVVDKRKIKIVLGSEDQHVKSGQRESVQMIRIHDNYTGSQQEPADGHTFENDLAVVELRRKIHTDCPRMRHVCFLDELDSFYPPYIGYKCVLAGFFNFLRYCKIHEFDFLHPYNEKKYKIHTSGYSCDGRNWNLGTPLLCKRGDRWRLAGLKVDAGTRFLLHVNPSKHRQWIDDTVQSKNHAFVIVQNVFLKVCLI